MTIMRLLIPCEEPGGDWPEVRAEATILARERIAKYELERETRLAQYARKWFQGETASPRPVLAWTRIR
jgi:hypothetical protein